MLDPHVRYPEDPGPVVPGAFRERPVTRNRDCFISRPEVLRYTLAPGEDPDVRRIREQIADEGKGLFVVYLGGTSIKALIEAYYPEDIRADYAARSLDPIRKVDYGMGRLVAIQELFKWAGELDPRRIVEIRRNHRNARKELKRAHDAQAHKRQLEDAEEERIAPALEEWSDFYADSVVETVKAHKVKNTPKRR